MREYLALLGQSPLFHGISPQELEGMLPCLSARELQADKHQMIFRAGDPARWVGLVLSGAVHVIQEDYYGNRSLVHSSSHPNSSARLFPALGWTPCRSLWKQPRTAGSCCWTASGS